MKGNLLIWVTVTGILIGSTIALNKSIDDKTLNAYKGGEPLVCVISVGADGLMEVLDLETSKLSSNNKIVSNRSKVGYDLSDCVVQIDATPEKVFEK